MKGLEKHLTEEPNTRDMSKKKWMIQMTCQHEYYPIPPKGKRFIITKEKCIKCGRTRSV